MSRTWAHINPAIRARSNPQWRREVHDHRDGRPCDLPDPTIEVEMWVAGEHACYWVLNATALAVAPPCGCRMCTGHDERIAMRRRDRRRTRIANRGDARERTNANSHIDC